jgi:hypothetical protein
MVSINWSNITDFGQIPAAANDASGGSFWVSMLYMMWLIMILVLISYGFEVAIVTASFVFLIVSIIMVYANLLAWEFTLTFAGVLLFMFLYIIWSSPKGK